ncbi:MULTISPECIES: hypothetical protein [unclassified Streptomyces]|nr:hypothetical protein [Streptomyces sp. ScaeMP-6W]
MGGVDEGRAGRQPALIGEALRAARRTDAELRPDLLDGDRGASAG